MKNILCYGDSNTYGCNPDTYQRYPLMVRWPGRLQALLGGEYHIIEEGLGGRTTSFDDPFYNGRNGRKSLPITLHAHQPLDLVIIMLGTNDLKCLFSANAKTIALGAGKCVEEVNNYVWTDGYKRPKVLLISPITLGERVEEIDKCTTFTKESYYKSLEFSKYYEREAKRTGAYFLDAANVCKAGSDDIHMDEKAHRALAEKLSLLIPDILKD